MSRDEILDESKDYLLLLLEGKAKTEKKKADAMKDDKKKAKNVIKKPVTEKDYEEFDRKMKRLQGGID